MGETSHYAHWFLQMSLGTKLSQRLALEPARFGPREGENNTYNHNWISN